MTNREHFAILRRGVEAWKQWHKEHIDIHTDLSRHIILLCED